MRAQDVCLATIALRMRPRALTLSVQVTNRTVWTDRLATEPIRTQQDTACGNGSNTKVVHFSLRVLVVVLILSTESRLYCDSDSFKTMENSEEDSVQIHEGEEIIEVIDLNETEQSAGIHATLFYNPDRTHSW